MTVFKTTIDLAISCKDQDEALRITQGIFNRLQQKKPEILDWGFTRDQVTREYTGITATIADPNNYTENDAFCRKWECPFCNETLCFEGDQCECDR